MHFQLKVVDLQVSFGYATRGGGALTFDETRAAKDARKSIASQARPPTPPRKENSGGA